jgi:hypothetical protein
LRRSWGSTDINWALLLSTGRRRPALLSGAHSCGVIPTPPRNSWSPGYFTYNESYVARNTFFCTLPMVFLGNWSMSSMRLGSL